MTTPSELERARAARDILVPGTNDKRRQEQGELDAFMAIFHPDRERIILEEEQ